MSFSDMQNPFRIPVQLALLQTGAGFVVLETWDGRLVTGRFRLGAARNCVVMVCRFD